MPVESRKPSHVRLDLTEEEFLCLTARHATGELVGFALGKGIMIPLLVPVGDEARLQRTLSAVEHWSGSAVGNTLYEKIIKLVKALPDKEAV